ncbi:MAG: hypothetical protein C4548_00545 [Desulfobacteraceae bacterium]|nr:MAG: hypothetical protein C4548_00545 [Desulfobacteraceae bacterium]
MQTIINDSNLKKLLKEVIKALEGKNIFHNLIIEPWKTRHWSMPSKRGRQRRRLTKQEVFNNLEGCV